jgi:hypothetical protein
MEHSLICTLIFQAARPGYFTTKFVNNIQTETTSTRRAGLIRFTYPLVPASPINHVVVDLTNDLGRSFEGGSIAVSSSGRVKLSGTFLQVSSRHPQPCNTEHENRVMALTITQSMHATTSTVPRNLPHLGHTVPYLPPARRTLPSPPAGPLSPSPSPQASPISRQEPCYRSTRPLSSLGSVSRLRARTRRVPMLRKKFRIGIGTVYRKPRELCGKTYLHEFLLIRQRRMRIS